MNGMSTQFDEITHVTFEDVDIAAPQREQLTVKRKPIYSFIKRAFDILVALMCLTVGLPVYLIIAIAIIIDDPGHPFFVQKRVGRDGKTFKMIKFRSMCLDAENKKQKLMLGNEYDCVHFKMKNDPRITKVGRFLRRTSLDEIPQAVNLLTGERDIIETTKKNVGLTRVVAV